MITEQQDKALQELGYTGDVAMDIDKAIRWLRENKGVHVYADSSRNWCTWYPVVVPKGGSFDTGTEGFDTHDLAQSAGLDAAIDYLLKQK